MNTKLRVYLADDHAIVRGGLKALIDAQMDMVVVGEAGDGAATIRDVVELMPDIAVIDVSMPTVNGIEATDCICRQAPQVGIVALTAFEDRGYLQILLKAGAKGYVVKRSAAEDLVRAIRVVAGGETYIDPAVAGELVAAVSAPPSESISADAELSSRESEVLRLIAEGYGVKAIAAKLNVGVRTVETYKARGMGKLGLKTRVNIIRFAVQQGWLKDG